MATEHRNGGGNLYPPYYHHDIKKKNTGRGDHLSWGTADRHQSLLYDAALVAVARFLEPACTCSPHRFLGPACSVFAAPPLNWESAYKNCKERGYVAP
jgi:hypothetical protein